MELEFFHIKKIMVSQPSQLKLKRVANHSLKRFYFIFWFLQYSIKILNEKNPPNSTKKLKILDKHYNYAYHHI